MAIQSNIIVPAEFDIEYFIVNKCKIHVYCIYYENVLEKLSNKKLT